MINKLNSIIINFDDNSDINAAYNNIKKLYPKNKIAKTIIDIDEILEDEYLLALAEERLKNGSGIFYSMEEVMEHLGITREELDDTEADEFE